MRPEVILRKGGPRAHILPYLAESTVYESSVEMHLRSTGFQAVLLVRKQMDSLVEF